MGNVVSVECLKNAPTLVKYTTEILMDTINIVAGIHFIVKLINVMIVSRELYLSAHLTRECSDTNLIVQERNP